MYRTGHYGAPLIAYVLVGFLPTSLIGLELAIVGGAVAIMLPDWDMRIPGIKYRGMTNSRW